MEAGARKGAPGTVGKGAPAARARSSTEVSLEALAAGKGKCDFSEAGQAPLARGVSLNVISARGRDDIHAPSAGAGATVVSRGGGDGGGGSSTKSGKRGGAVADRLNQVRSMGSARGKNGTSGMCDGEDERRATGAAHAVYAGPFSPPKGGEVGQQARKRGLNRQLPGTSLSTDGCGDGGARGNGSVPTVDGISGGEAAAGALRHQQQVFRSAAVHRVERDARTCRVGRGIKPRRRGCRAGRTVRRGLDGRPVCTSHGVLSFLGPGRRTTMASLTAARGGQRPDSSFRWRGSDRSRKGWSPSSHHGETNDAHGHGGRSSTSTSTAASKGATTQPALRKSVPGNAASVGGTREERTLESARTHFLLLYTYFKFVHLFSATTVFGTRYRGITGGRQC